MSQPENLGSFINENKILAKEYIETRLEIIRLKGIRASSKAMGFFIWTLISIFSLLLIMIFLGVVLGLWLSELTGSYIEGFGITTLIFIFIVALLAIFRKSLFVNPVIKVMISKLQDESSSDENDE
jgi:lipopolysaccharide export LptBFGC system permease protein LptF